MATAIVNKYGIAFHGLARLHIEGPGVNWEGLNGELKFVLEKKSITSTDRAIWELKPGTFIPGEIMLVLQKYGFEVIRGSDNYDEHLQALD